ncbi:MAG TPA: cell division protein FtsA [Opitutales bacterium]|nr:cell division protein FtsA [Opitutales bacterium]
MGQDRIVGAIEIGTSKVTVLVAEIVGGRSLNIIGTSRATSEGVRKGQIVSLREVSDCTHAAIAAAEKTSGAQIDSAYLAISGAHLQGFADSGVTTVSSSSGVVTEGDIRRARENAKMRNLPQGRIYIHHECCGFQLDGRRVADPVGMQGEKVETGYWHIHGDERITADHLHVINGIGLNVECVVVSAIASASVAANDDEKKNGVLVIDIGAGTADYALYRMGTIVRTGVVPIGGDHITNDLAIGLRMNVRYAESVKLRFGKAVVDPSDKSDTVMLIGDLTIGDRPIPRIAIDKIVHSRVEELFMIVKNQLGSEVNPQNVPVGVILTGGTARLPHICDVAQEVLGVPARIADSPTWVSDPDLRIPECSTALGLLSEGFATRMGSYREETSKKWYNKLAGIFGK